MIDRRALYHRIACSLPVRIVGKYPKTCFLALAAFGTWKLWPLLTGSWLE